MWHDIRVSAGARYQMLSESLRELARREPTFALHVHVGIPDPELAVRVADRLRAHVPLILALSANSPYWQGRDSGMASARTPLFQAFPRVGIPRQFGTYQRYVEAIDVLIRGGAIPEPTFVWWDVRLQPRFGTVEVRIADAQTRVEDTAAIVALVQAVAKLEAEEDFAPERLLAADEVLAENRFLAARDGMNAKLVDPVERPARPRARPARGGPRGGFAPRPRARLLVRPRGRLGAGGVAGRDATARRRPRRRPARGVRRPGRGLLSRSTRRAGDARRAG